jgi:histidine triad (HIT) family protein
MDSDCLFCRIARGEVSSTVVRDAPGALAFEDLNPQAPTHVLIIPKRHIASVADLEDDDTLLVGQLVALARDIARERGLDPSGYRLVINTGSQAGQSVAHLHLHLLGGRVMRWPPG